jgi:hypothetical protein
MRWAMQYGFPMVFLDANHGNHLRVRSPWQLGGFTALMGLLR